jgi:hypothetical protein
LSVSVDEHQQMRRLADQHGLSMSKAVGLVIWKLGEMSDEEIADAAYHAELAAVRRRHGKEMP